MYIIRNIRPSNRDDVERVQHFMKWQAMALPPAQELTTLISEGNKMTWSVLPHHRIQVSPKSIVLITNFELLLLRLYIGQTASPWVTTNVGQ